MSPTTPQTPGSRSAKVGGITDLAREHAESLGDSRDSPRAAARVRNSFVRRRSEAGPPPPLARCLRGGQGGEVRLKLYLCALYQAVGGAHDLRRRSTWWAELLCLPDPAKNGSRRVSDALGWLARENLIRLDRRSGDTPTLILLDDAGSGRPYSLPTGATPEGRYFDVPRGFFSRLWVAVLSGRAIAALLIGQHLQKARGKRHRDVEGVWAAPGRVGAWFDLNAATFRSGMHELADWGIASVDRRVGGGEDESYRMRNYYRLHPERLEEYPEDLV